ncbi:MAG TPA: glycosyltransferase [Bacteroidota bacterium]|nr:glycosyltransferase [Bacteroidota bacterium]
MKIIIVGTAFPLRGGIAHFNALLASHLKLRHGVETVTFKRQYPKLLFPGKTQEESGEQAGIEPAPQLVDSINPFNWWSVARQIAARHPDLLIFKYWLPFFGPCFGTIAGSVKKRSGAKVIYICDNIIPHERRPGDVAFTRYAFRRADGFIVQSDAVEKDLRTHFPGSHYRKVPHPVYENFGTAIPKETARKKLGIRAERIMLFFGYVRAYKGLFVLIDAMSHLKDAGIHLLVVGEFYDDEQKYRSRVEGLGLGSSVTFVSEYVPNDRVGEYFSAADVVVLPYLSATQSGIVQIAYNFDKPVIATTTGGLVEVVVEGKTGFLVPPGSPKELAGSIRRFYDEKKEAAFVEHVKTEKKKYSWDSLVENIEALAAEVSGS